MSCDAASFITVFVQAALLWSPTDSFVLDKFVSGRSDLAQDLLGLLTSACHGVRIRIEKCEGGRHLRGGEDPINLIHLRS